VDTESIVALVILVVVSEWVSSFLTAPKHIKGYKLTVSSHEDPGNKVALQLFLFHCEYYKHIRHALALTSSVY